MLALSINNPVVEQYFHHNPKEASDLLEAVATKRVVVVAQNEQNKTASKMQELQELINFNRAKGIKVAKNINIAALANGIND